MINTFVTIFGGVSLSNSQLLAGAWVQDSSSAATRGPFSYNGWSIKPTLKIYICADPTAFLFDCIAQNLKIANNLNYGSTMDTFLDSSKLPFLSKND